MSYGRWGRFQPFREYLLDIAAGLTLLFMVLGLWMIARLVWSVWVS